MSWAEVAAPGTDPRRLERATALLAAPRGGHAAVTRRATALELDGLDVAGVLDRLLAEPSRTVREAVAAVARAWRALGVRAAVVDDPLYPGRLAAGWPSTGAPLVLAWRGEPVADRAAVAIVGARRATGYGTGVAAWLAEAVADAGVLVVSGGAVGIDAAAHRAAVAAPGGTAVVLGCGHDVAYPRGHARPGGLFDQVLDHGGTILSELLPGTAPRPHAVLARNRIVAGLSDAVVVVEGRARSGALSTAGAAADLGTPVLAVPGDVRAPGSAAPHRLLHEGAAPCTAPGDVLELLGRASAPPDEGGRPSTLPGELAAVLAGRWPRPIGLDELAAVSGLGLGALLAATTRAEVAGEVVRTAEGVRLARAPAGTGRDRRG